MLQYKFVTTFLFITVLELTVSTLPRNYGLIQTDSSVGQEKKLHCEKPSEDEFILWYVIKENMNTESLVLDRTIYLCESNTPDLAKAPRCIDTSYNSFDLVIRSVDKKDKGTYECKAPQMDRTIKAYDLEIKVKASIHDDQVTSMVQIQEGNTARLICNASGYPSPFITWKLVDDDGDLHDIGVNGSVFQVQNVSRHCGSNFACFAQNDLNKDDPATKKFHIEVRFGASVDIDIYKGRGSCGNGKEDFGETIKSLKSEPYVERSESDLISLVCSASGSPNVTTVEWLYIEDERNVSIVNLTRADDFRYNTNLSSFRGFKCPSMYETEVRFGLTFHVFDKHFTNYTCKAWNEYGADSWTVSVRKRKRKK